VDAKLDLTLTFKDSVLTHNQEHQVIDQIAEILVAHKLLETGDVIETTCGFGVEIGQRTVTSEFTPVASRIWGGPN